MRERDDDLSRRSMKAHDIVRLLAKKHKADVFVPECKDGPTQYGTHRRLDAWTMNRSWSNACCTGYEIKVSRSDFLQDHKWPDYLPLCNALYFVCPARLISVEEIPSEAGLMWVAKTGTCVYTKKKAPYRQVEIPESLWRYVLMCRSEIRGEHTAPNEAALWRRWLEEKRDNRELGWRVRGRIRETVVAANEARKAADLKVAACEETLTILDSLGINPSSVFCLREQIRKAVSGAAAPLGYVLRDARHSIEDLESELARINAPMEVG